MAEFYVKVVPDQDAFHIDMSGTYPEIHLMAPASQGKANDELVSRLSGLLGADVGIMSGHHSRRKKIAADRSQDAIEAALAGYKQGEEPS